MPRQQVALVTGASSGIGRAIASLLSREGFQVFGTTRKTASGDPQLPDVKFIQLDVRQQESVQRAIQSVLDVAGRIDLLVNNAGYALIGAAEETSVEETRDLFETNFFGLVRVTQTVLPAMRAQSYGRIVNIGSVAGFVPMPFQGAYAASKHAIEGFSKSLDHEVRQFGIRVSVIEPGFTKTELGTHSQIAARPLAPYAVGRNRVYDIATQSISKGDDPGKIASVVLKAIRSRNPQQSYLAGRQARQTTLLLKLLPSALFDMGLRKQFGLAVTN